ncbi:MAG: heparan-alpha-glucosaminide N-acetyltransferase domain-containing protein, partial [Casimicrobiaceae bacterium]
MTAARDAARRTAKEAPATASARVPAIDVLRAFALFAMIGYHFAFDLRYFGVIRTDFEHDPVCLVVRGAILASFLLLAGVSLALAQSTAAGRSRFWLHVARIAGCALAVSIGSLLVF